MHLEYQYTIMNIQNQGNPFDFIISKLNKLMQFDFFY